MRRRFYYCRRNMGFLFWSRVKNAFKSLETHTSHPLKDSDAQNLKETYVCCFLGFFYGGYCSLPCCTRRLIYRCSVLFKGNKRLRSIICDFITFVTLLWDETSYKCINSNFLPNSLKNKKLSKCTKCKHKSTAQCMHALKTSITLYNVHFIKFTN